MMEWEEADVAALAGELIATGLATPNRYNHLTLNPALCPYLRARLDAAERDGADGPLGRGDGASMPISSCSSRARTPKWRRR